MKKTNCIQLVLITAALAGCDKPLYQQGQDYPGTYDPGPYSTSYIPMGDQPDSGNSCPMVQSALPPDYYLWYSGLRPFDFYFGDGFNLGGYYAYRYPPTIIRTGFGRTGYAKTGSTAHS
ncbi:MAG TPA: hypothetical protein VG101_05015 [Puia sp.]|jgi:hypothetical protein|nr:hypothetical protein [Puia sp.]